MPDSDPRDGLFYLSQILIFLKCSGRQTHLFLKCSASDYCLRCLPIFQQFYKFTGRKKDLSTFYDKYGLELICRNKKVINGSITKTRLYNFDPLKPHFYVVKLRFTGVYIIFLISAQNIDCGYSLEPPLQSMF